MIDFKMDLDTEDVLFDDGGIEFEESIDKLVAQRLLFLFRTNKGELESDPDFGIDWTRYIFGQDFSIAKANMAFIPEILATEGVSHIKSLRYRFNGKDRLLTVLLEVVTTDGTDVPTEFEAGV